MDKVIIVVKDGQVTAAYSNNANLDVIVCDWDNAAVDESEYKECKAIEAEINESHQYTTVY